MHAVTGLLPPAVQFEENPPKEIHALELHRDGTLTIEHL